MTGSFYEKAPTLTKSLRESDNDFFQDLAIHSIAKSHPLYAFKIKVDWSCLFILVQKFDLYLENSEHFALVMDL